MELAVATDDGLIRLGVLSGRELATVIDAGAVMLPGLIGAESATTDDWGVLTPQAVGRELAAAREAGWLGGWRRTETATTHDSGITVPAALLGRELSISEDEGLASTGGSGFDLGVTTDYGHGGYVGRDDIYGVITSAAHIQIPPWVRYIDIILLGGGGGGCGGTRGVPGWDGDGGRAGQYTSRRWDRGESRNDWTRFYVAPGAGGNGGGRNGGHGGNGGATELWIDNPAGWTGEYLSAPGGAGGAGNTLGGGVSGAQKGRAPGNHTFNGITATGGGENGGTPGAGGRGGTAAAFPLNPGSGDSGARGQAWYLLRHG